MAFPAIAGSVQHRHFVKSPVGIDVPGIQERKNAARRAWIASNVSGRKQAKAGG
jgi:hypothetical protein